MARSRSQSITRWAKLNHVAYCVIAYRTKDTENFCRNFILSTMNRKNITKFKTSIVSVIHTLTGWEKDTIKKALQILTNNGEIKRHGHKIIQFNPDMANRVVLLDQYNLGYTGKSFELKRDAVTQAENEKEKKLYEDIQRLIKGLDHDVIHTSKEEEMQLLISALTKQLETKDQQIEKLLLIVEKIASGGEVSPSEAKKSLKLVKPSK